MPRFFVHFRLGDAIFPDHEGLTCSCGDSISPGYWDRRVSAALGTDDRKALEGGRFEVVDELGTCIAVISVRNQQAGG